MTEHDYLLVRTLSFFIANWHLQCYVAFARLHPGRAALSEAPAARSSFWLAPVGQQTET
jgi:hypothetical protein